MKIEFLLIADAVEAVNGKLYVMGGCWDRHTTASYPANIRLGVAVALRVAPTDRGLLKIAIKVTDDKGDLVTPEMLGEIDLQAERTGRALLAVNSALQITHSGKYEVHVQVGDKLSQIEAFESGLTFSS